VHKTIKRVGHDLARYQFNTSVSALMELTNLMQQVRDALRASRSGSGPSSS
jgi:leucyl-tRNA synthetase